MRTLVIFLVALSSTSALAASTADYTCYGLMTALRNNGVLNLDKTRFVCDPSSGSFCSGDERAATKWVPTKDFHACPVYTCVSRSDRNRTP